MSGRIKFSTCVALSVVCLLSASFLTSSVESRNVRSYSVSLQATSLVARVVGVADGDTITVLDSLDRQHKVRLAGIDAPERGQDFTNVAKRNLSDLVFNKTVTVFYHKKDRYGRLVGKVMVNGTDVNLAQVRSGLAWHYKEYANEQSVADRRAYASAEDAARDEGEGIWSRSNPTPPWEHRSSKSNGQAEARTYLRGPKGGCYYINSSGNKSYVDRSMCGDPIPVETTTRSSSSGKYIRGPRGGCYYINSKGKKTYVSRALCN